ncbi:NADPH-dependent FMN reductase [Hyphomicrobium sp. 99]|uniref:NADPH-dependent FMN reductase n=1 Tax=Hyphomicrobium sp. 99 TaxID=1163419 RepID=UPI0005F8779B|nr:NADPH-dependent FMN reductase [Hyphomicrobium sp. 99]
MPTVLVVSSSPSEKSKTAALAQYVTDHLSSIAMDARHLRLRELPPAALVRADTSDPAIAEAAALLKSADGAVLVTPTYKASYSGLLKIFLDLLPQYALAGKAILPLATGGTLAHALMLDYALRPVLHSLGARHCVQGHFVIESVIDPASPELITDTRYKDMLADVIRQFDGAVNYAEKAA